MNAKDKDGYTPLVHATLSRLREIAKLLIAEGADVNAKDDETTLDLAEDETANLLCKHGGQTGAELK